MSVGDYNSHTRTNEDYIRADYSRELVVQNEFRIYISATSDESLSIGVNPDTGAN